MSAGVIKRADWLIAISVLAMVALVWLVLTGFDTLIQFLRELGDVGEHGYTAADAAIYIAWTVPRRAYEWFGNAALIGGLLGLGGLATSGEITALRAAGMSKLRMALSVVVMLAGMTALVMLMGETVAPYGAQQAKALQLQVRSDRLGMTTRSGLWAHDGDKVINAKAVLATGQGSEAGVQLADVRVFDLDASGRLTGFVHAHDAIAKDGQWTLHKARVSTLDASGVHSTEHASLPWSVQLDADILKQSVIRPAYLSMRDLWHNMSYLKANQQDPVTYAKAFWQHVFYPLNVLALVLCAMPFAFGTLRSGGVGKRLFIGVVVALGWHFLQQGLTNMGIVYGLRPWLADLLPVLVLVAVAFGWFRKHA